MMNAVKACVIFLSMPAPSRSMLAAIEAIEAAKTRGVVCLVVTEPELPKLDLNSITSMFEMLSAPTCDECVVLKKEVRHEVTQTPGTKPANPQPRRYVGKWDREWG